ncbi:cytochrome c nitrite reductase subunit NrfD [Mergibacter septicus]|uniref:cytochrome c nitrite reductase subunit NrfD n=1 Tax=Mergibacter septicus TaxID=221402 RepID=UPI001C74D988|nr:cytochrome c nitrite reductase subunit NrfD [Mergibacter septicus]QDJ12474.1 cytochrome c nitrite reductase subunit NrfD [Mergibacter septicus]
MTSPFHFPSLVWDEIIAIYLFLLGISAGVTFLAVLYKRSGLTTEPSQSALIRNSAIIAPLSLVVGLTILIFHLTKPWAFWYLMFNYHHTSIMSMGVMLFQFYMLFLCLWLAIIFRQDIANLIVKFLPKLSFINPIITWLVRFSAKIEIILLLFSILLGAYTGFLLSALISYPMLNNPVLPVLFLVSGISSGVATLTLALLLVSKTSPTATELTFIHKFEFPLILIESFLLFAFCIGLYLGGGQKTVAIMNAIGGGFWANVFWVGIVIIGLIVPALFNGLATKKLKHKRGLILLIASFSLFGILCLRFFILYAGQMTLA